MSKMTIVQLGVIVFAFYLSSQVLSQNAVSPTPQANSTNASVVTTMATGTLSSSTNSSNPNGGSATLQAGRLSFLIPVVMSTSILRRNC